MYNIIDFGYNPEMNSSRKCGTPARITAVHKNRFAIVSDFGEGFAQLKQKEYFYAGEVFPTVGDFVLIDYVANGDLDPERLLSYQKLKTEAERNEVHGDFHRQKRQWEKALRMADKKKRKEVY